MKRWRLMVSCVVAGAIVNVAVAWGCTILSKPSLSQLADEYPLPPDEGRARATRHFQDETGGIPWDLLESRSCSWFGVTMTRFGVFGEPDCILRIPGQVLNPPFELPKYPNAEWQFGWPCHSLEMVLHTNHKGPRFRSGWSLSGASSSSEIWPGQQLPIGPIWNGFAANTAFYAAILWLLIRGPAETRRRWREFRGCCGKCGYPRGDSAVCTECGASLSSAWSTTRAGSS